MKSPLKILISFVIALLAFSSCSEDRYLLSDELIGDGTATVAAEVSFKTYTPALDETRTAGNALNGIDNLYLFVYSTSGKLIYNKAYASSELTISTNTDKPSDSEGVDSPISTAKASFTFPLDYGKYRIYVAANIRGQQATDLNDPSKIATEQDLKQTTFQWDSSNIANNDQMFGFFYANANASAIGSGNGEKNDFDADVITINNDNVQLTAWMRRLASKVTVAYDGSGLNEGVFIYVKNVTIHDIPKSCYLGMTNTPNNTNQLLNSRSGASNEPDASYTPSTPNTRITYDEQGSTHVYDRTQSGLEIYSGLVTSAGEPILKGSDHSQNADALFFYENMQGNFENESNKNDYDKRQHASGKDQVGTNIRDDIDGNDYKDRVKYGTYVEVEAYYVSINPKNPSQGDIKYRFMLGKNVTYNYNAQRNYHFKLTLGFKGWANQPDWHIDYDMPDPALEVPPFFRVSYLYHQKSMLPVKVTDNCTKLEVEIVENNWAPCDPITLQVPKGVIESTPDKFQFQWNIAAYNNRYKDIVTNDGVTYNQGYPYLGFLALNLKNLDVTIPKRGTSNGTKYYYDFSSGVDGQNALKAIYESSCGLGSEYYSKFEGNALNIGSHESGTSSYEVTTVDDGSSTGHKVVLVPLWTRAKTMIEGSGFSGNNPYEYFNRKATLKITGTYQKSPGNTETLTEYVTVLQEPRIVNPKAVWRKSGTGGKFHVVLMTAKNSNAQSDYEPLLSEGGWSAYVEKGTNISLATSTGTIGEAKDGKIIGRTGSNVDFDINFNGDGNAIVAVTYHGDNCTHKIFCRQGYDDDVYIGENYWNSYALYRAVRTGGTAGTSDVYTATMTQDPRSCGSYFKRYYTKWAILETNNDLSGFGFLVAPQDIAFNLPGNSTRTWTNITAWGNNSTTQTYNLGTYNLNNRQYKVPELSDFEKLKAQCEFGYGVLYGAGATETSDKYAVACGYIDTKNNGKTGDEGVRGVIVYDPANANQLFFSVGKSGYGRRRQFNFTYESIVTKVPEGFQTLQPTTASDWYGALCYSDVQYPLVNESATNNIYRPVPYNLPIAPGAIFWINKYQSTGHWEGIDNLPSLGWDVNYFNYDFNSYTKNNYQDACLIKLIRK